LFTSRLSLISLNATILNCAAARVTHLERGAILDEAGPDVAEHEAADRDVVGFHEDQPVRAAAIEYRRALANELDALVDDHSRFRVDACMHDDSGPRRSRRNRRGDRARGA